MQSLAPARLGALTALALSLAVPGYAQLQDVPATSLDAYVAVWHPDGSLASDATVEVGLADGTRVKLDVLGSGVFHGSGLSGKTTLEVDDPVYGSITKELRLPVGEPRMWLDVSYTGPGAATLNATPPMPPPPPASGYEGGRALDLCIDALELTVPGFHQGTTFGATIDDDIEACGTAITAPGVWFRITGTGTRITCTTCGPYFVYDTKLSVYCGSCTDGLTCVGGNDDDCAGGASDLLSTISFCSQPGTDYYVLVHGFGAEFGGYFLQVEEDGVACDDALDCVPRGACCLPDGSCADGLSAEECMAANGIYQGDDVACVGDIPAYTAEVCTSAFEDISATGTPGPVGDDAGGVVPIGFTFNFYGALHGEVGISTNGYLSFGADLTDFSNDACPNGTDPNDAIFALWDDYVVDGTTGTIHYQTLGAAPDRRFIVQWTGVNEFASTDTATFQAVLHEADLSIELRYLELNGVPSGPGDATIGVENADGSAATCVDDTTIQPGACVRLVPQVVGGVECPVTNVQYLDIKPGSCPNSVNNSGNGMGVIPVALLGTASFDVTTVDVSTLLLSRADGVGGSVSPLMGPPGPGITLGDTATPFPGMLCDCHELTGDKILDLNLKFDRTTTVTVLEILGLPKDTYVELVLTGTTLGGEEFMAMDCIRTVGNNPE